MPPWTEQSAAKGISMKTVNMHEAKTHLSRLVTEEFIIAKDGRPVARVTPILEPSSASRFGFLPGIHVPADFDEMGAAEVERLFGADQ